MKNIKYTFLIFLSSLILYACNKNFLDIDNRDDYSTDNTFVDSLGFEAGITGLMQTFRDNDYSHTQGALGALNCGTDIATQGGVSSVQAPYDNYNIMNSNDAASAAFWKWGYLVIARANVILKATEGSEAVENISQATLNRFAAEARFYRAYCYNFLINLFGDVPLVTEPSAASIDFTRTPVQTITDLLIEDLKFAIANLPDVDNVSAKNKINNAAASQLLAELYLRTNQPELAKLELLKIINSKKFLLTKERYGVKAAAPGDPFSDMFLVGNCRRNQGNREAIWVVEQWYNINGGGNGDQRRREWVPLYGNFSGIVLSDSLGGRGIGRIRPSAWWMYNLYEENDMRNSRYNIRRQYYYNDPKHAKFGQVAVPVTKIDSMSYLYVHPTKWYYGIADAPTLGPSTHDIIHMRLGETYLLLAEAQWMLKDFEGAAGSINKLRERAHASMVDAGDVNLDLILDERARELIAEELRRTTLVRTGTLIERTKRLNPVSGPTIKPHNMLLPIPQGERDLNPLLGQNPNYY